MRTFASAAVLCFLAILPVQAADAEAGVRTAVHIPAQALSAALKIFEQNHHMQVIFVSEDVRDVRTRGASGEMTSEEVLRQLLSGTGLTYRYVDQRTVTIIPVVPSAAMEGGAADRARSTPAAAQFLRPVADAPYTVDVEREQPARRADTAREEGEIVVTGTHIRGVTDLPSPVQIYTRRDIENNGFGTVEKMLEKLPQNFAEISTEGARTQGGSRLAAFNIDRAAGVDLRGLGADSTLTLLNGRRRAASIDGRVVDVSVIPLVVIERVEVVTGGRSAIYGSDAVGGVVNFVTRRDFQGARTGVSYGLNREGSETLLVNQIAGANFTRGGFIAAYDYQRDWSLNLRETGAVGRYDAFDTEYLQVGQPDAWRHSGFAAGRFDLSDGIELHADTLYSYKKSGSSDIFVNPGTSTESFSALEYASRHLSFSGGAVVDLGTGWSLDLASGYSEVDIEYGVDSYYDYGFFEYSQALQQVIGTSIVTLSAVVDGPLPMLGGFRPRLAAGVDAREEERSRNTVGFDPVPARQRRVRSLFAELLLPWAPDRTRPGLRKLELSLAGRYDDYSDFGGTFNPQAGVVWAPFEGLRIKGAFSEAFRAPALADVSSNSTFLRLRNFIDPAAPAGTSPVLMLTGSSPDLGPETARTWSAGIEFEPAAMPWASFSLSYFDIRYDDRLDVPAIGSDQALALQREEYFLGLIDRMPTAQRIDALLASSPFPPINETGVALDLATQQMLDVFPNLVIFDNHTNNIAIESVSGLDLGIAARFDGPGGRFSLGLNGTYTLDHQRRLTTTSPAFPRVNEVGKPAGLRIRASAGWTRGAYGGFLFLNHVGGYDNPFTAPGSRIDSWTTVDLNLSFDGAGLDGSGWLRDIVFAISVNNLLDTDFPRVVGGQSPVIYDPANASALGRTVSVRLAKEW